MSQQKHKVRHVLEEMFSPDDAVYWLGRTVADSAAGVRLLCRFRLTLVTLRQTLCQLAQ